LAKLTADKDKLYAEYRGLKDEVTTINDVKREVDEIIKFDGLDKAQNRKRDYEID